MNQTSQEFIKENKTITKSHAIAICETNYSSEKDMVEEFGNKEYYNTKKLLMWLGY